MEQQNNVVSNAAEFPSPPKSASPLLDEWGDSRMEDVAIWFFVNSGDAIMVVVNLDLFKEVLKRSIEHMMCSTSSWCPHSSDLKANLIYLILHRMRRPKSLPLHCGVYPPGGIPRSCLICLWFHWNRKQKTLGHQNINRKVRKTSSIFTISFK